ncbi:MAG TPA: hypothetical protein VFC46_03170, partial [Humisphaera sp.]|nr:hypothetical protein [Humisphaera sp.]
MKIKLILLALLLLSGMATAQSRKPDDDSLEDIIGPSDETIRLLTIEARSGNAESRAEAIWKLGQHEKGIPALSAMLADAPADVLPHVVISLGWEGKKALSAIVPLTACLAKPSYHTQTAAVWTLGRIADKSSIAKIEPFLKAPQELLRFLAQEAIARCNGKELLPQTPLYRPLKKATLLHVSDIGDNASAYLFSDSMQGLDVGWKAITVRPFNPSWSGIGGMPPAEEERFSELLSFVDGHRQVDAILISNLYPGELSFRLRWELWNYVRRGGKLIASSILFQPMVGAGRTPSYGNFKFNYVWKRTLFDTLLPDALGPHDAPFLDGIGQPERSRFYGEKVYGRGRVIVHDKDVAQLRRPGPVPMADVFNFAHQEWRHLTRVRNIGENKAEYPLLWRQLFMWAVQGPTAFPAGIDLPLAPSFKAGSPAEIALIARNYDVPTDAFKLDMTLFADDGLELGNVDAPAILKKGQAVKMSLALPVPFTIPSDRGVLQIAMSDGAGHSVRVERIPVDLTPACKLKLTAPDVFDDKQPTQVGVEAAKTDGVDLGKVELTAAIADINMRPLLRQQAAWDSQSQPAGTFAFSLPTQLLPPDGYWVTVQAQTHGQIAGFQKRFIARPKLWRGRDELGFMPWGNQSGIAPAAWRALRAANLHGGGLPEYKYPAWNLGGTEFRFVPFGQWRGDMLAGRLGEQIRAVGTKTAHNPYLSALDVVEESDLEVGTALFGGGNVEREGHEQYRIYLKQKYGSLTALNAAWKTDYLDWSEIRLLGGVKQGKDDVSYTTRMGGTSGEMVPVPGKLDPTKGIVSLLPYQDQNAWRWSYLFQLIEVWTRAFHQTDPWHGLMPGGHMGLSAPFDFPHTRIYANNAMSILGLRATLGRPTYGDKPHIILMGLNANDAANSRLVWQGLAAGARLTTIYAPGDGYGVRMQNDDFTLTPAGQGLSKVVGAILPKQEVFLATRNVVSKDVLFLGSNSLSPEYYESFLRSGVLLDYGRTTRNRRLIVSGAVELSETTRTALREHVENGGALVLLNETPAAFLKELGLQTPDEIAAKSKVDRVQFLPDGPFAALKDGGFFTGGQRRIAGTDPAWKSFAHYAKDGAPAVLHRTLGKGAVWFFNFQYQYSATLDLMKEASSINEDNQAIRDARQKLQQDWYTRGTPARRDVETFRRMLAAVMDQAGVTRACETIDTDGSVIPYVETQLLETFDGSQRYLVAWADIGLPPGVSRAAGQIALKLPGVKAVYNVYRGEQVPLQDGRFSFTLEPGRGTVYSLITEPVGSLEITPEATTFSPGAPLRIALRPHGAANEPVTTTHSFNVQVRAANGAIIPGLTVHTSGFGYAVATLLPSWNDAQGAWTIEAEDLTTGAHATTRVTMKTSESPPPMDSQPAFRPTAPDISLKCAPIDLPGFGNFVSLKASLKLAPQHAAKGAVKVRITLQIPPDCILNGEVSRELTLTPDDHPAAVSWDLFISHDEAVAMYYSAAPFGFRTGLSPLVHKYEDVAYPAIKVEALDGTPVSFAESPGADWQTGNSFRSVVPLHVMPFESSPLQLAGPGSAPADLVVWNRLDHEVAGVLRVATANSSLLAVPEQTLRILPGASQSMHLAIGTSAPVTSPAILELPVTLAIAGLDLPAGNLSVETVIRRSWLTHGGAETTSDANIA